ncbi:PREDICTED: chymotrypsin inhibitor-like isoform X1 [Polistes dominula]|uniref:Chymotrypsin inhibitor-like isoform X1 n=1 Tax=Polistes dominula TaxID=743375 RepID=A0ABM1I3I1_POLDO|nr:PREDICTED: chymotrypsin inhibitor-like isoform X1 [Polistes dominula]
MCNGTKCVGRIVDRRSKKIGSCTIGHRSQPGSLDSILIDAAAPERPACGPNQIFDTCGTACPPTCKKPSPDVCILLCVSGCRCKDGFVKNDNGDCVLTKDC